jgi:hypothetical protein
MIVAMTDEPLSSGVPGPAEHRWTYPGDWLAQFDHLAGPAYVAARAGSLDAEMAFNLACFLMTEDQPGLLATKLAEQVCPAHDLGAHAREHEDTAVWWCNNADGHVIAAIGKWRR